MTDKNFNQDKTETKDEQNGGVSQWLLRAIVFCLFLLAFAAPLSIAATQTAFFTGLLFWVINLVFTKGKAFRFCYKPLEILLILFFLLTALSSFFSYEPQISIGKLRSASLFLIALFVSQNIRSEKIFKIFVCLLIGGAMISVGYTLTELALGKGVKVRSISPESPLYLARCYDAAKPRDKSPVFDGVRAGNTIVEAGGKTVSSLSDIFNATKKEPVTKIRVYRNEWFYNCDVETGVYSPTATYDESLGVADWSRGRDQRAAGFFGHYTTYGEALQLILSLTFGLFIALERKFSRLGMILAACILGLGFALLLTVTRGSQLGFFISAFLIVIATANRRFLLVTAACALPLALIGVLYLQQKRHVGFFDQKDNSVSWRQTVWREGFRVLTDNPKHLLLGVGMDSLKRHWQQWGMFDGGRLPVGHLHSTPLQIAFERGVPALFVWLLLLGVTFRMLWRLARSGLENWILKGSALGALGAVTGFFVSGFVHYNLGDSEVAMIFYIVVGISLYAKMKSEKTIKTK